MSTSNHASADKPLAEQLRDEANKLPLASNTVRGNKIERRLRSIVDELAELASSSDNTDEQARVAVAYARRRAEQAEQEVRRARHNSAAERARADRAEARADQVIQAVHEDPVPAPDRPGDMILRIGDHELPLDADGYYVYCLWGDDPERPMYVGESQELLRRLGTHLSMPARRPYVRRITATRCVSAKEMHALEARMISKYSPPWNVKGVRAAGVPAA